MTPLDQHPSIERLMGGLIERSDAMIRWQRQIDHRLQDGDARMGEICERLAALEATGSASKADQMPALERGIKIALPYVIGGLVLLVTGKVEVALKAIGALTAK